MKARILSQAVAVSLACFLLIPFPAAAEDCYLPTGLCFGVSWRNATPNDVRNLDVKAEDEDGRMALHHAAFHNSNSQIVATLIEQGAKVNAKDKRSRMPLHYAAERNSNPEVIQELLNAGARVDERGSAGETPLHNAAGHNKSPGITTILLEAGADVRAKDRLYGQTPLHFAAEFSTPEVVLLLIGAGSDVNAQNRSGGATPLDLASAQINGRNRNDIRGLLLANGARCNKRCSTGDPRLR